MDLGTVIAERTIEGKAADGSPLEVVIRFGTPRPDPLSGNGDWECPHQIGAEPVDAAYGVDSVQALLLSIYAVRIKLSESGAGTDWMGMRDFGLTVAPVIS
ncbi:DUF6968 family protein [Lentzea sp. CA-135723]|uniref:DUF6968 family protein n=1 Tax=Lentzea sp. CA-135723 TaxID=3239950 RepID=UPI003D90EDC9